ncbi:hypothetical protein [Cryobacterium sp. TMT2-42-4]|uniref:hypothetical protein n=1 Tax=Cryobacterium sp. TMT2-42-4 TaxID=1259255 RepID=UPI00106C0F31|nr:hypothetical protein [Cryobacterium sp. TMT2-42-4]TFC35443.1 hypothetical protein E3O18_10005 [Cryobacterium sp. TMT2-42-4]
MGITALLGWMIGISPNLKAASGANADRLIVEQQNADADAKLAALKKQFEGIGTLKNDLASVRMAVPEGAAIPAFLRQLGTLTSQNDVRLTDFSVGDAERYAPAAPATSAVIEAPVAEEEVAPVAEDAAAAATTPATVAAAPTLPAAPPGITGENFVAVPITVSIEGSYSKLLDYLDGLQKGERLALVTSIETTTVSPDISTAKIAAYIYVLLNPASAAPTDTE